MTEDDLRAAFEKRISRSPYERSVERRGPSSGWPGSYRDIAVSLAWDVLQDLIEDGVVTPVTAGGGEG
jgi:hypothetical protein